MSNFSEQLEEIKTLILSPTKSEKSFAYSTLQHLQEQSSNVSTLIPSLLESTRTLLSSIITDIRDADSDANEEIVTLALKCLGFMIYHPSFVAVIPNEYVDQVLESLARLIMTTKVKLVCNLGVWCISIQQLDASSLACHFNSLLMAIVHSLDNPTGSLSTTFEAIQAVTKLATQISEKMRDTSSVWAPPIYRRLLSADKREREMCLRCLLKTESLIVPPQLDLSKAIVKDMKLRLLPGMKELLKHGKKVQALQAWRWFVCILGSYSLKTRHLVNEMLKVPEQTFSDPDPQVQNASLVAWEGLIDALVYLPSKVCGPAICQHQVEHNRENSMDSSEVIGGIVQTGGYSKSLKLIMMPLIGIMTSKEDSSIQSSCLRTWCYLLHKLDSLVNDPHILDTVVDPMFKVAFNIGLQDRNIWIWRFCINLLQDFIQAKITSVDYGSLDQVGCNLSDRISDSGTHVSGEYSLKNYSVKWLPWDSQQMDFLARTLQMIFNQVAVSTPGLENRRLVADTVLRMFHSFLKGVRTELAKSSTTYDTVMQSINAVLMFVKTACEAALHGNNATNDFQLTCLRLLGAVNLELDSSILGSPLYKVSLDLKYISDLGLEGENRCKMLMGTSPIGLMDMVPPVIYLTRYFLVVVQVSYKTDRTVCTLQEAYNYFNNLLSAYDSLEVIHAIVALLYIYIEHNSLLVWTTIAKTLRDYINDAKDLLPLEIQTASPGSLTVCHLMLYPFVVCSSQKPLSEVKHSNSSIDSFVSSVNLVFEEVTELWVSLYCLINSSHLLELPRRNLFAEDLCLSLKGFLQRIVMSEGVNTSNNSQDHHLLSLCGDVAKCILENLHIDKVTPEAIKYGHTGDSGITNCLEFAAWVMKLLWIKNGEAHENVTMSRLFPPLTHFVGCLQWQEDIFSLIKVLCDPLLLWLSNMEINCENIKHQLQLLWTEIIRSLQRSWPAIIFNSSTLKLQSPLLAKTLDHPNPSISEPTIAFWNSAYGDQTDLDFPPCLLHVLDKLSRLQKIKVIKKENQRALARDDPSLEIVNAQHRYRVTATLQTCSKRVELSENKLPPCQKRKRSELTEHQKEVRRAQQGKRRDCSGHGPGIRTYTSVDFSQGNDDSQDSQDIRDPELILDLLRRPA